MLFLSLKLAREVYAVETLRVKEVLQPVKITRVPRTGLEVCGVINLRGSIITVFDLRMLLGMEKSTLTPHSNIVVLEYPHEGELLVRAFLVDSVREVLELDQEQLGAPPASRGGGSKHLQYMAKSDHGFILILDVANLFGLERIARGAQEVGAIGIDDDLELPSAVPSHVPPAVRVQEASVEDASGTRAEVVAEGMVEAGVGDVAAGQRDIGSAAGVLENEPLGSEDSVSQVVAPAVTEEMGDETVSAEVVSEALVDVSAVTEDLGEETVCAEVVSEALVDVPAVTEDLGEAPVTAEVVPEAPVVAPDVTEDLGEETVCADVTPEVMAKGSDSSGEGGVCDDEVKKEPLEGDGAFRSDVAMAVGGTSISSGAGASGRAVEGGKGVVEGEGGHEGARMPGGQPALEQNRQVFVTGGEPSPEHRTRLLEVGGLAAMAEALEVPSFSGEARGSEEGTVRSSDSAVVDASSVVAMVGLKKVTVV
ncbi:MAG: chemotaxis protein CheW [Magnetococcales bacterium]|nr:chemotaxis protein CheW [Magnetococcales bacterium]